MRVNELAKHFGVTSDTVRHYTRLGILRPAKDEYNGYKRYGKEDVKRLRFSLSAKHLGFTLTDIQHFLGLTEDRQTPCPVVRQIIQQRLQGVRRELDESYALYQRMQQAIKQWDQMANQLPTGETICELIEHWDQSMALETRQNTTRTLE